MISEVWKSWQVDFQIGLVFLGVGLVVVLPCLLFPSLRRKILRSDIEIEIVGAIAFFFVVAAVVLYNYLRTHSGS